MQMLKYDTDRGQETTLSFGEALFWLIYSPIYNY